MIKRLDGDVASRIAAGEVIERPVSVAKELIENSLDAGAKSITLYLEQGGKVSFVIEDDGIGIAFDELPLALERYATSKISSLEDLENITTLGYRGEALASVAAVSRMEIRSRAQDSDSGGLIRCEGGAITLHTDTPCQPGTRIQVDDLFFNLPARRKFLKNASAELRRIIQVVNDYAMIHPDVVFRVFSDGKRVLEHPGAASVDEMLEKRWGTEALRYYAASSHGEAHARVWWNPLPDSRRVAITLFVNGRRVQDATVRAAITSGDAVAYGEWLVLLEMPPEQLDVNIHPTKEEIRFRRSQDIFKIIYENTHAIFNQKHGIASADTFIAPREDGAFSLSAKEQPFFDRNSKIFSQTAWEPVYSEPARTATPGVGTVYVPPERADAVVELPRQEETVQPKIAGEKRYIGQTARGFLLFDFPDGLAILDPHAAHERIL
ncbi:DNA mismatch repair endonuclease MutL, partial [Synergistaceae bacterium OttesenSCG-928-D05]|nr:DNA mismatch repair endonuclease MutL [Synergistaceae bacterium OttesenSCG-928-D05]